MQPPSPTCVLSSPLLSPMCVFLPPPLLLLGACRLPRVELLCPSPPPPLVLHTPIPTSSSYCHRTTTMETVRQKRLTTPCVSLLCCHPSFPLTLPSVVLAARPRLCAPASSNLFFTCTHLARPFYLHSLKSLMAPSLLPPPEVISTSPPVLLCPRALFPTLRSLTTPPACPPSSFLMPTPF